jgi:hypothetical protein
MHYTGWLRSCGTKFDSSVDRKRPFYFEIGAGAVIQGWERGVMRMSLGETSIIDMTAALGYGARGLGPIPGGADLTFEIQLLKINELDMRTHVPATAPAMASAQYPNTDNQYPDTDNQYPDTDSQYAGAAPAPAPAPAPAEGASVVTGAPSAAASAEAAEAAPVDTASAGGSAFGALAGYGSESESE